MRTEAERKWDKENKVFYGMYLMKSNDMDIITYLDTVKQNGGSVQGAIKEAIRYFLAHSGNNIYTNIAQESKTASDKEGPSLD
ncbi:hypothetical protein [Sphaerochaeta globosa]|uniref:Uncharacterized protein n=1 Tax=Sphaerochaeta globosa (strain ATCC BAA-1886 / DSM 22777 / Buddy) TaxID=158189 RepID=F0RT51_SPHGB|nr:hypothetical protein [Sphaerochaeta globosa]ADY14183.1 hypothetical protein SpiBuddy_2368 [Sphaerochaeta globosa str. Buddy]